jgi:hypothetical protein
MFMKRLSLAIALIGCFTLVHAQDDKSIISKLHPDVQFTRPGDKTGLNMFETGKEEIIPYDGLKVRFGAGFSQQCQSLTHSNSGAVALYPRLAPGFGIAQANLTMDVQLYDGIKLNLTSYLAARHHNETWVKGGYIQFDKLPFKGAGWDKLMQYATIKVGHMEINYGDQHFRRSDGGNTIHNPFMENYIMDAFATEIGGEFYLQKDGVMGMVGVSNGLINGTQQSPVLAVGTDTIGYHRNPSFYAKGAIDKQLGDIRVRGAASVYYNNSTGRSTLYAGDRTGSNYFFVMEGATATSKDNFTSGRFDPALTNQILAFQLNGFIKAKGLELFGTYENARGRNINEKVANFDKRSVNQLAADIVYRIGAKEKVFIGARYNTLRGQLLASNKDKQSIDRIAVGGGWFLTNNILMKGEYVDQKYNDFPAANRMADGRFKGFVMQAVVGF